MKAVDPLLDGLSEPDRKIILDLCVPRKIRKRTEVVRQGEDGRDMFIVSSGHLRVSAISSDGKELSFGVLGENDYFGELSLLDGRRRSATVTAIEDTEVLVLGFSEYQRLLKEYPHTATQLLTRMVTTLASRLRLTDELYQDAVFLDVSARLAKFLLFSSSPVDNPDSTERMLSLELSQYELGTLINASRESVNKQLREWEELGVVTLGGGNILLRDTGFLRQRAGGH